MNDLILIMPGVLLEFFLLFFFLPCGTDNRNSNSHERAKNAKHEGRDSQQEGLEE